MWTDRTVEPRLIRSAKTRQVIVLTVAGQKGKTSGFRRLFPRHALVSLDLPDYAESPVLQGGDRERGQRSCPGFNFPGKKDL
jgi:hypothetical protein